MSIVSQYEAVPMEAFAQQDFEQVLKRGRKILSDRKMRQGKRLMSFAVSHRNIKMFTI